LSESAIILGIGAGGLDWTERYYNKLQKAGEEKTPASWLIPHQPANSTDLLANRLSIHGPRLSLMTACSSSATAIGVGYDMIRLGRVSRAIVGGTETLCRFTFGGFSALRAMDDGPCRPFHLERQGLTLGEGAAILVLEEAEAAHGRSIQPYAEIAGYGVSADAHHLTAPAPDGRGAILAMRAAINNAQVDPCQVDYINAHGTGTRHNDPIEIAAIRKVFGPHAENVAISSTKAMTGHTLGAAGAIEAAICATAMQEELIPPTLRLDHPDPACDLDLVPLTSRHAALSIVMSNSFAFGGNNTSIILRRVISR
jgi:3-oxoacyl-[acyl-carrier-protein] synthase II